MMQFRTRNVSLETETLLFQTETLLFQVALVEWAIAIFVFEGRSLLFLAALFFPYGVDTSPVC
ncbi:MAG TPA: hypothetical protein V6C84_16355 [Coleofasciculaceae cyanobacterium]|jgi:hypothetical protein